MQILHEVKWLVSTRGNDDLCMMLSSILTCKRSDHNRHCTSIMCL